MQTSSLAPPRARRAVSLLAAEALLGVAQPVEDSSDDDDEARATTAPQRAAATNWHQLMLANDAELRALGAALPPAALAALCDDAGGAPAAAPAGLSAAGAGPSVAGLYVRLAHCLCFRSALLGKLGEYVGAAKSATATLRALAASERAAEPPRSGSAERARMEQLRAQAQHNLAIAVRMHRDRAAAAAATAAHDRVEVRL